MLQFFMDSGSVLCTLEDLAVRNKNPRVGLRKNSETSFSVFCFLEQGVPKINYDIEVTNFAKGELHSLPVYNTFMRNIPEDRISLDVFRNLPQVAAMKAEANALRRGVAPNSVLFYIIPGTNDALIYSRENTYFENVEPVIVDTNNVHEIIGSRYPLYEDPRPLNTLRLKTLLTLDPNDSLAYLEAQTDFLTAIVLALLEKHPELKLSVLEEVAEYANFKDAVSDKLVFGIKDTAKCLDEIRINKAAARQAQSAYYAGRAGLEAARRAQKAAAGEALDG